MGEEYYQLDFGKYFKAIYRQKWLVILCLCSSIALAILTTKPQGPLYQASISFWVRRAETEVGRGGITSEKVMQLLFIGQENPFGSDYNTQMRIIKSSLILKDVVKKLGLPSKTEQALKNSIDLVRSCISVYVLKDTSIMEIKAIHPLPDMAVKMANAVYEVYTGFNNKLFLEQEQRRLEAMEEQAHLIRGGMGKSTDLVTEKIKGDMYLLLMEKIAESRLNLSLGQTEHMKIIDRTDATSFVRKGQSLKVFLMGMMGLSLGAVLAVVVNTFIEYRKKGV